MDLDQTLNFSTLEWWLIGGGVVLTLMGLAFTITVWLAAAEVLEYYKRENDRHRAEMERDEAA